MCVRLYLCERLRMREFQLMGGSLRMSGRLQTHDLLRTRRSLFSHTRASAYAPEPFRACTTFCARAGTLLRMHDLLRTRRSLSAHARTSTHARESFRVGASFCESAGVSLRIRDLLGTHGFFAHARPSAYARETAHVRPSAHARESLTTCAKFCARSGTFSRMREHLRKSRTIFAHERDSAQVQETFRASATFCERALS